jgi:hypothetical protein
MPSERGNWSDQVSINQFFVAVEHSVEHFLGGGLRAGGGPISTNSQCVSDCVFKERTVQIVRQMIRKFSRRYEESTALANDLTNPRAWIIPAKH